jgi:2-polyprenyl-3-methyl-5-hydroxy-6-metoxy-1,4-benzoquinol methylase
MKKQAEKTYAPNADSKILSLMETFFPNSKTVLDLGCGLGGNLLAIKNIGLSVTGVTISPEEATVVSQICSVFTHDLEKGLPAEVNVNHYDVVIAAHLLEHIFYPDKLLTDVQRVMRRGVIVVIPNLLFWRNRAKMLLGIFEYQDLGIMDYTHSRWYTFETIQTLLVQRGFVIKLATATGGLFGETTSVVKKAIDSLLLKCFPGLFGFQFYVVASNS